MPFVGIEPPTSTVTILGLRFRIYITTVLRSPNYHNQLYDSNVEYSMRITKLKDECGLPSLLVSSPETGTSYFTNSESKCTAMDSNPKKSRDWAQNLLISDTTESTQPKSEIPQTGELLKFNNLIV